MEKYIVENQFFSVRLTDSGILEVQERLSGKKWHSDHPFKFCYGGFYTYNLEEHCRMKVQTGGSKIKIDFSEMNWFARFPGHSYRKPDPGAKLNFHFEIELNADTLLFLTGKIRGLDDEECTLHFPYCLLNWECKDTLNAVIPWGYGQLVDYPRKEEHFSFQWEYFGMPIYGVFQPDSGIGVRVLDPCDHKNTLSAGQLGSKQVFLDTEFIFNRRFANYPRRLLWKYFPAGNDFTSLAKWYRSEVIREKKFVTLEEKIQTHPDVEKIAGAVIWKHSVYSQKKKRAGIKHGYSLYAPVPEVEEVEGLPDGWNAYELFDKAHAMGFDRLCVFNTGWNHAGFDSGYPTRFPVNPERGSEKDFHDAAEYARSLSEGFIYSVHDNYTDIYENASELLAPSVRIGKNQAPEIGGIWRGGRAKIQCTEMSIRYAGRDIPKIAKMLGKGSIYVDVMGSSALKECYSSVHPASRRQDLKNRRLFMKYVREKMGSLASEAIPCDATTDLVDLGAYLSSALESSFPPHIRKATAIPLWQLVYHDSVYGFTNAYDRNSVKNYYALCALFGLLPGNLDMQSLRLSRELRKAYTAEMVNFQFLTVPKPPYCYVAKTLFSDGTEVISNLTDQMFSMDGCTLKPHDFLIRKKNDKH